jgi:crotonobetainyl-CoA:carnitine CoA-transferase CaiB-like acyl-CoA transferase
MTGYQATIGILAALHARERTGEGQKVSVSMLASMLDCQVQELVAYLNAGASFERTEQPSAHAWIPAPYGVYRSSDGWIVLAMAPLPALGEALDEPRLVEMTDADDGVRHRDQIQTIVAGRLAQRTTDEWIEFFDARRLWSGPVATYDDLARHPQVSATQMIATIDHPDAGPVRMPAPPLRMSGTPASIRSAPPRLGADTDEAMREWSGWSDERVDAARARGAFGVPAREDRP